MGTGSLEFGLKILYPPLGDRCVFEATVKTCIIVVTAKSVGAREKLGSHVINIGLLHLE